MKTGALIAAAGFSDKKKGGSPLEQVGTITAIERIVATLRHAGISRIVVVTGHNRDELERLLVSNHVIFLKNEHYETTDMLESVKIGLQYLKGKCERILFTPADIPLFTSHTVVSILNTDGPIVVPVCKEEQGHPVLFHESLIDRILSFNQTGGLQVFLRDHPSDIVYLPVDDRGILQKAPEESQDEYNRLLKLHNSNLIRVKLGIELAREKTFFDEQVYTLLMLINETENVREACSHMHISYTSSWNLIQRLENELHCPMVSRAKGGARGSHSKLTREGKEFLQLYASYTEKLRKEASRMFNEDFKDFFRT